MAKGIPLTRPTRVYGSVHLILGHLPVGDWANDYTYGFDMQATALTKYAGR